MKETEITFEVFEDFETSLSKLINQGCTETKSFTMIDTYFCSKQFETLNDLSFEEIIKSSILLRQVADDKISNYLIYKNKEFNKDGVVMCEEKIQTCFESYEQLLEILNLAGFKSWVTLTTKNVVLNDKDFEFVLQDVEGLGLYVEIEEQPFMQNLSTDDKRNALIKKAKSLKLKIGNDFNCKKAYLKFNS